MYTFKLVFISYNLLLYSVLVVGQKVIPQDPVCSQPLVKNIPDEDMTTPGEQAVASGKEGKYARLHNTKAWCIPQIQGSQDVFRDNVYLEINLRQENKITAIALQGDGRYRYGEAIKIFYEDAENNFLEKIIPVKNYDGNRVEYVVLSQHMPDEVIITKKIRIQPNSGSSTKCLRLELYGCGADRRELECYKCRVTNNELITDSVKWYITTTSITHGMLHQNDGEKLLFSEPYAWCVMKSRNPTDHYIEKAEVSFKEEYLIYGLQVDGYRRRVGLTSTDYITSHFKLEYALEKDGKKTWAFYNTGIAIPTEPYTSKQLTISPPLAAKFVRIYMRVNDTSTVCIKLQLYGCKASLTPEKEFCKDKGGCEHICEPIYAGRLCLCRSGYFLAPDRQSCIAIQELATDIQSLELGTSTVTIKISKGETNARKRIQSAFQKSSPQDVARVHIYETVDEIDKTNHQALKQKSSENQNLLPPQNYQNLIPTGKEVENVEETDTNGVND